METSWSDHADAMGTVKSQLEELDGLANKFGSSMSKALAGGIAHGKSFDDILKTMGERLVQIGLQAAFKPLESGVTSLLGSLTQGLSGGMSGLMGGGLGGSVPITPFADGGVIASPGYFPLGGGLGLAGEAGPEAIMPLTRGSDGKLGVAANGSARAPVAVTVNIQTPNVESFARAESQVSAALARAVARGRRST